MNYTQFKLKGTCKVRNGNKMKWNETEGKETKLMKWNKTELKLKIDYDFKKMKQIHGNKILNQLFTL